MKSQIIKFIRRKEFQLFEFGEGHISSRTFFKDFYNFLAPNYKLSRIVPNGLRPISGYTTDLEVFNTINYLAELQS
jgi:hypothetical protein